ncbi:unnamed protein product [Closterium sp. NIES-65]|nr:unnamed protein product [Closterium sp. NIES-65]
MGEGLLRLPFSFPCFLITLSPPSCPASLVLPTHSSSRRPSQRRPVARIVASIDVALAVSRRGPPLSSRRHAISPLPSHRLSSPVAFPLPLPFLRRFPLPSPLLSRCPSSVAFISLRLSSPVALPLSRRPSSLLSPILSPAALPSSRRPSSLPSPFLSPVSYPLSRHPSSLPSPLPSRLPLFRRPSSLPPHHPPRRLRARPEMPARRPMIVGPSRFSLAALLSPSHMPSLFSSLLAAPSSPPSHHPRCLLSPPITLFLSVRITPLITLTLCPHIVRHHRVTLSLSPHITLLVAAALPLVLPSRSSRRPRCSRRNFLSHPPSPTPSPSRSPQNAFPSPTHFLLPSLASSPSRSHSTPSHRPSSLPSHHRPRRPHARSELPSHRLSSLLPNH